MSETSKSSTTGRTTGTDASTTSTQGHVVQGPVEDPLVHPDEFGKIETADQAGGDERDTGAETIEDPRRTRKGLEDSSSGAAAGRNPSSGTSSTQGQAKGAESPSRSSGI